MATYQAHLTTFARQNKWEEYTGIDNRSSLRTWKAGFEETARLLMLPEILWGTGARLQIHGPARKFLIQNDPKEDWSYNEMCLQLADEFDKCPKSALIARFDSLQQRETESLGSYASRLYDAFLQAYPEEGAAEAPFMQATLASRLRTGARRELSQMLGIEMFTYNTFPEMKAALMKADQAIRYLDGGPPARGRPHSRSPSAEQPKARPGILHRPASPAESVVSSKDYRPRSPAANPKPIRQVRFSTPQTNSLQMEEGEYDPPPSLAHHRHSGIAIRPRSRA